MRRLMKRSFLLALPFLFMHLQAPPAEAFIFRTIGRTIGAVGGWFQRVRPVRTFGGWLFNRPWGNYRPRYYSGGWGSQNYRHDSSAGYGSYGNSSGGYQSCRTCFRHVVSGDDAAGGAGRAPNSPSSTAAREGLGLEDSFDR